MKRINQTIEHYLVQQKKLALKSTKPIDLLKQQIRLSKDTLEDLRFKIRHFKFKNENDEVYFFKYMKPVIHADFIFYKNHLRYLVSKPNTVKSGLRNHIKNEVKKLESKKRRNIKFYTYMKQKSDYCDFLYFLRKNKQLSIFDTDISVSIDNEFYTSHDILAAEVIAYELLTEFYKKEIQIINNIEKGAFDTRYHHNVNSNLNWTGAKTDLIELVYALKVSGVINNGAVNIKELIEVMSVSFNIEITNYYKTYTEIKSRSKNRTKFLNKLKDNFQAKLECDDEF